MKIFGREPAVWIAGITALITMVATFVPALGGLDFRVQAALTAVWALITAWKVRPVAPSLITGAVVAVLDLFGRFGLHLNYVQVGALDAFVVLLLTAVIIRPQSTPVDDPDPDFLPGRATVPYVDDSDA